MPKKKDIPWDIIFDADADKNQGYATICDTTVQLPTWRLHAEVTILCIGKNGKVTKKTFKKNIQSIRIIATDGNGNIKGEKVVFS